MNKSQLPPSTSSQDLKVLGELFREAIGYDQGLLRTFKDLRKHPKQVLEGYMAGDRRYVSPFRLLITSLSLWIVINGFLVDWYSIWKEMTSGVLRVELDLISWLKNYDDAGRKAFEQRLGELAGPIMNIFSRFAGDLFTKWYVPFVLISVVGGSLHFSRRQPSGGIGLRESMYILCYSIGSNILMLLVMSIVFGINLWAGVTLAIVMLPLQLTGRSHFLFYAPIRSFFETDGITIEKKLMRSVFLLVVIAQLILILGYILYFKYIA